MSVSIDGARLAQIMNSAVEQTYGKDAAKNVKFEAKGDSITVSYTDEAGNVHNGVPIELSPADVDALADPAAMESVLKKISKDIKIDDPGVKEFLKCLNKTVNDVLKNGSVPMPDGSDLPIKDIPNVYVTLFAIMALMQEAAKTMKESAVASRESALKSEVQAIMNQAAQEKAMAWTSLISSFVTMGVQVGVSSFLKSKEIKADVKANQELTKQGVDMNKMLMDDTMKLGDVGETQKCMELRGADLDSVKTMKDIAADVGGLKVDDSGRLEVGGGAELKLDATNAKTDLDTASKNLEAAKKMPIEEVKGEGAGEKPTAYKFDGKEFATKEDAEKAKNTKIGDLTQKVNDQKGKLVGLMDQKVNNIRDGLEIAEADLARAEANGGDTSGLQRKVNMERKNLIYANAVRTELLATPVKGEKLITPQQAKMRIGEAQREFKFSHEAALNSSAHESWRISSEQWGAAGKCLDYFFGALNSLTQQLPQFRHAEATKQGEQVKQAESDYTSAEATLQAINETQHKILQAYQAIIDSWIRSSQCMA